MEDNLIILIIILLKTELKLGPLIHTLMEILMVDLLLLVYITKVKLFSRMKVLDGLDPKILQQ